MTPKPPRKLRFAISTIRQLVCGWYHVWIGNKRRGHVRIYPTRAEALAAIRRWARLV